MIRDPFATFRDFWPYYLGEHRTRGCRVMHYLGAVATLAAWGWSLVALDWRPLVLTPWLGYGPAWFGHLVFERNRPATWSYVRWSLLGEFRMLALALAGRLHAELERLGIATRSPAGA